MADLTALKNMIIEGDGEAVAATQALVDSGASAQEILDRGLLPAMDVVGQEMKNGTKYLPQVMLSARTMQDCLSLIKPMLGMGGSGASGTVVIGTVEGDVHDIGKNLVAMLLESSGFTVVNLGKDVKADDFIAAVKEHQPDVLGMSALLTTTLPRMSEVIGALESAGLRDQVKVMVGGAPVSQAFADEVGADSYGDDAATAVEKCRQLIV